MYDANKPYGFINLYDERQPSFNTIFLPEAIYNVLHFGKTLQINILSRHTTRGKFVMFDQGSTFIVISNAFQNPASDISTFVSNVKTWEWLYPKTIILTIHKKF